MRRLWKSRAKDTAQSHGFLRAGAGTPLHSCGVASVEDHAVNIGMSPRFAATKIVENDTDIIERLALSENELEMMEHSIAEMEKGLRIGPECGVS